jgi:hypothetical protein
VYATCRTFGYHYSTFVILMKRVSHILTSIGNEFPIIFWNRIYEIYSGHSATLDMISLLLSPRGYTSGSYRVLLCAEIG